MPRILDHNKEDLIIYQLVLQRNCQSPSEYTAIDEQLPQLRTRCTFRQYIPNITYTFGLHGANNNITKPRSRFS